MYVHACGLAALTHVCTIQVADTPIVLTSIPRFHLKFLQAHLLNGSVGFAASLKTIEIPFYIRNDFLYFNASKASEIGLEDMYHVVITANGTEPGMVGMVLTTVYVEKGGCAVLCPQREVGMQCVYRKYSTDGMNKVERPDFYTLLKA